MLAAPVGARAAELGLGVQLGAGTRDAVNLSLFNLQPEPRGEAMAAVDLRLAFEHWALGLEGWFGASWFEEKQENFPDSETQKDQSWAVRPAVDRLFPIGSATRWWIGAGFEYGEWRSWWDVSGQGLQGPRTYFTGGVLRTGLEQRVGPVDLRASISESVFGAHASYEPTASELQWSGRSTTLALGVRYVLSGRPTAGP